jgi:hypothetical protein
MTQSLVDSDPSEPLATAAPDQPKQGRLVDRIDPWAVRLLTVLGFGLPVVGYFYLLSRDSLNVIIGDQWDDITVIRNSYVHFFDWGSLWAPHNENRLFFPNLIVEVLARTTQFNIQVEEYLGAVMLVAATGLLIWAHKRRSPSSPWLYYCPVAVLLFSIVQWQNTLWGFQMAWYLVLLCLAACIVLLDRVVLGRIVFTCALAIAVVGSFSSLQGLIIWPAGLILLYHRRRQRSFAVAWIIVAIGSVVLYFHNFNGATGPLPNFAWQHPVDSLKFYFTLVGDIAGVPLSNAHGPNGAVMLLGLVIVGMAILTVLVCGIRRDDEGPGPVGIALICYGLLFGVTVTQGRLITGYASAGASRYTTFELLIVVGIYMALLGRVPRRSWACGSSSGNVAAGIRGARAKSLDWLESPGLTVARWSIFVVIMVQIIAGLHYGPSGARANYEYKAAGARVLRNIDHSTNVQVQYYLYLFESPSWIRMQARYAQEHHLSLFDQGRSQAVGRVNVQNW